MRSFLTKEYSTSRVISVITFD